ncbi:hypothetical protein [Chitinibacter tainanensis]|uniref:hypothetical protein n=1 Tax=Chitinibacter tainanensis TaxID=230667 RepID=UPI002357D02B|nr:hypothetical protein [Chitinibacter tainanensis]
MQTISLAGTWELVRGEIAEPGQAPQPYDMQRLSARKVLSATGFAFITLQDGQFYSAGSGSYTLQDGHYVETIALASWGASAGTQFAFRSQLTATGEWQNERFGEQGERLEFEIWRRVAG